MKLKVVIHLYSESLEAPQVEADFTRAMWVAKNNKTVVDLEFEEGGTFRVFPDFEENDMSLELMDAWRKRRKIEPTDRDFYLKYMKFRK